MLIEKISATILSYFTILSSYIEPWNNDGIQKWINYDEFQTCMHCHQLSDGHLIPVLGLGTMRLGKIDQETVKNLKQAIDVGYRLIDTADIYGNEQAIGQALAELFEEKKIKRNEVFVTTKVWNTFHSKDLALESVRKSLEKLRLTYLDLVLVHWPVSLKNGGDKRPKHQNGSMIGVENLQMENFEQAYLGLEAAKDLGLTRSIGVSNFNIKQLKRLSLIAKYPPTVNQVECHPYLNQSALQDYCRGKNIRLEAYSPFRQADKNLLSDPVLEAIALKHRRTVPQIIIRWLVQRGIVPIPKTSNRNRMIENLKVFNFELDEEDMLKISELDRSDKSPDGRVITHVEESHLPEYPFRKD